MDNSRRQETPFMSIFWRFSKEHHTTKKDNSIPLMNKNYMLIKVLNHLEKYKIRWIHKILDNEFLTNNNEFLALCLN